jgi:crotonobetainyl-CoA:carnitine CoA-transferase CaiB-like acyl-CoA transferase
MLKGREDLLDDERLRDDTARLDHTREVIDYVETWLCSLSSREEGLALLGAARISSGPVLSQEEMLTYPLYQLRGTFGTVNYPGLGDVGVVQPPFKFSDARAFVRGRAPEIGEHTRSIVASRLGKTDEEVDDLIRSGVLSEPV